MTDDIKRCVLYERECINCGECDKCDLDPDKICDNCMKCIRGDADYKGIKINGIVLEHELNVDSLKNDADVRKHP